MSQTTIDFAAIDSLQAENARAAEALKNRVASINVPELTQEQATQQPAFPWAIALASAASGLGIGVVLGVALMSAA